MEEVASTISWLLLFGAAGCLISVKGAAPWEPRVLIASIALMTLASAHVHVLTNYDTLYDLLPKIGKMTESAAHKGKSNVVIWNIIIPLILGGIGCNLFCSWLLAKKPEKTTTHLSA